MMSNEVICLYSKTKYPILLVHGMGFRDNRLVGYWGRIPKMLEELGCDVYFGYQDSNADVETNGEHLAKRIMQVLEESGAEKVNIIAHSKGGLDSRYAISSLNMGDKVASLTTISTPHHGSKSIDVLMKFPLPVIKFVCFFVDCWFRLIGDKKPNTYRTLCAFTTDSALKFNAENVDFDGVFYQSYAFVMKKATSDMFLWLPYIAVKRIEGENDGLLTPDAVKWGNFKGVYSGAGKRGISHCDEVDMRRRPLSKKQGDGVADILDIYKEIASDLTKLGL